MKIAVIFSEPEEIPSEQHWLWRSGEGIQRLRADFRDVSEGGVSKDADLVVSALATGGHEAVHFSAGSAAQLCGFLAVEKPDLIFNCCEGIRGDSSMEMNVAAVFELFGIPFSGSPAATLSLALDKGLAKAVFGARGIPTPRYAVIDDEADVAAINSLKFPVIVKPLREDASIGIDVHAVVHDSALLARRVQFVLQEFRHPALVEEFIDGREFNVAVLARSPEEFEVLPISEILFQGLPEGTPHVFGYEAKWIAESPCYCGVTACCPAEIPSDLAAEIRSLAISAVRALGVRDYGRVDIRQRQSDGKLFVIEVNPNPDLSDETGFLAAARASGTTYAGVICQIAACAIERSRSGTVPCRQDDGTYTRYGVAPRPI